MNLDPRQSKSPDDRKVFILAGLTTAIIVLIWMILTQTSLRGDSKQPDFTWKDSFKALGSDINQAIENNPLPERDPILSEITNEIDQSYETGTTDEQ